MNKVNVTKNSVDKLLKLSEDEGFTGCAKFTRFSDCIELNFKRGLIENVYKNGEESVDALDECRAWESGEVELIPVTQLEEFAQSQFDINEPVQIAKDTYWVGYRNPESMLQVNVYLRIFKSGNRQINMLIDPGSPIDYEFIKLKIEKVIGDISKIHLFSVNHQDPDVGMNGVYIQKMNPNALLVTSEDNWRLVQHYGFNPKKVKLIDKMKNKTIQLVTGHKLKAVETPFCHFKGAFALYDEETKLMFTGDFFCGLTSKGALNNLYATEETWEGISAFHKMYMPSSKSLYYSTKQLRKFEIKRIAPQHGDIIPKKYLESFMSKMEKLSVGIELMNIEEDKKHREFQSALDELVESLSGDMSSAVIQSSLSNNELLMDALRIEGGMLRICSHPRSTFDLVCSELIRNASLPIKRKIKHLAIRTTVERNIMPPSLNWEAEEESVPPIQNLELIS